MPRPTSEHDFDPTRQQLEDLQSLLDRMLQIPVLQPGDVAEHVLPALRLKGPSLLVPPGSREIDSKNSLPTASVEPPLAPVPPPLKRLTEPIVVAPAPLLGPAQSVRAKSEPQQSIVVTAAASSPSPAGTAPTPVQSENEPVQWPPIALAIPSSGVTAKLPRFDVGPPQPLALLPLRAINWCFDTALSPLGTPGRWLSSRPGRNLLGWTGVILILLAAGWGTTEATVRWIAP
jgi:hypothetical protein